jgi:hypothetical protein
LTASMLPIRIETGSHGEISVTNVPMTASIKP